MRLIHQSDRERLDRSLGQIETPLIAIKLGWYPPRS